jgi:hypothetical protein
MLITVTNPFKERHQARVLRFKLLQQLRGSFGR